MQKCILLLCLVMEENMKPVIDMSKEYSIVLDGGGARGAYQIGAWKALKEAGIRINAVAGTSVGALNGAMICMDDLELAEKIWREISYSKVMDVDDEWMDNLFQKENSLGDILKELWKMLSEGGLDISPLKEMIHNVADEEKIRNSGIEFCIMTFSVTDLKPLDLSIEDIPEGMLEDFLLASAYLFLFKSEKLHGKTYMDGGIVDNVPRASLINRGYRNLIEIRINGPGREPYVKMPDDMTVYQIEPRVKLGSIIEFNKKRSSQNLKIGYYDAKRVLYGLEGKIYYIEQTHEECYYSTRIDRLTELERASAVFELRMNITATDMDLYLMMLEASAKIFRIPKYKIYTVDELLEEVRSRYENRKEEQEIPKFVELLIKTGSKCKWAGREIYRYDEIDSTNIEAARLSLEGAVHGSLVIAEQQNAGKGRRGRKWESPAGKNIYMSLLLKPKISISSAPRLTLLMAYSTAKAIEETLGIVVGIKWPNDLIIGKKKICGILTEMKVENNEICHVVIGVGINANMEEFPEDIREKATSLKCELDQEIDRSSLIECIMEHFEENYEQFLETEDLSAFREEYNDMLVNNGREVRVLEPANEYEAVAYGINNTGELMVQKQNGDMEAVFSGEVSVRGIYDYV